MVNQQYDMAISFHLAMLVSGWIELNRAALSRCGLKSLDLKVRIHSEMQRVRSFFGRRNKSRSYDRQLLRVLAGHHHLLRVLAGHHHLLLMTTTATALVVHLDLHRRLSLLRRRLLQLRLLGPLSGSVPTRVRFGNCRPSQGYQRFLLPVLAIEPRRNVKQYAMKKSVHISIRKNPRNRCTPPSK